MKKLGLALMTTALLNMAPVYAGEHGGGNGGDDLELELKKRSLQIASFLKSDIGKKTFNMINPDGFVDMTNRMDIDVTSENVVDKYGTLRTCVNEPERALITCNLKRMTDLQINKKSDVLTAILFHEILGLIGVELGYQENVSMYPISSKILPYNDIIIQTPITDAQVRPEFYGLDQTSYGITIVNKETQESLRMICLNNNVEVHRCRNYGVVKSAQGRQIPLITNVVSISPSELEKIKLAEVKIEELKAAEAHLKTIQDNGFKYLALYGTAAFYREGNTVYRDYRYGAGLIEGFTYQTGLNSVAGSAALGIPLGFTFIDTAIEIGKQGLNVGVWPIRSAINLIRLASAKQNIKQINKVVNTAKDVLNLNNDLSLVGKSKTVSAENYNRIVSMLTMAIVNVKTTK